jgi:hypothetical protein
MVPFVVVFAACTDCFAEFIPMEISGKKRLFERLRTLGEGIYVQNAGLYFRLLANRNLPQG